MKQLRYTMLLAWLLSIGSQAQLLVIKTTRGETITLTGNSLKRIVPFNNDEVGQHEAVDLGLSVLWSPVVFGASESKPWGTSYRWGQTTPGSSGSYSYDDLGADISRTLNDVVRREWRGAWRMPTLAEVQELAEQCTTEYDDSTDMFLVTGPSGNSITIARATHYWTSTCQEDDNHSAWNFYITSEMFKSNYHIETTDRDHGYYILPVKDKTP